jgi:serine/threonine protein kinase
MDKRLEIFNQVSGINRYFVYENHISDGFPFKGKVLYNSPEFIRWKENALFQLYGLKQEPVVMETIELLNGFNGWHDEEDFQKLQAKMEIIIKNIDELSSDKENGDVMGSEHLGKGTVIHTALNDYELIKQEGSGGNGRVFAAKDSDEQNFAIKFVQRNMSKNKYKRLKNEIYFCEKYSHPNIINIIDRGYVVLDNEEYVFYVMPLYKETLRDKMKTGLSPEEAIEIFIGVLKGLWFAHEHGAIHRDIKPENILFDEKNAEPVLCDFGIAHFSEDNLIAAVETRSSDRMANFQYAAPEQRMRGRKITAAADVYATALILNEMFTGEIPQSVGYKKIGDVNSEYSFLDEIFEKLYKQNPQDRLSSVIDILTELKLIMKVFKKQQEQKQLEETIDEITIPKRFQAFVVSKEYIEGNLAFVFNEDLPNDWINIMLNEPFTRSSMMGYDKNNLRKNDNNILVMPLKGRTDESSIKTIVGYFDEWVFSVNNLFNKRMKEIAEEEQRYRESERKERIKKLETENRINLLLADL